MDNTILFIHVMKTAGTSLRSMLTKGFGAEAVYPNSADRDAFSDRRNMRPDELVTRHRQGRTHAAKVLFGHIPYIAAEEIDPPPTTVTVLRDPVARTLSIIKSRIRRDPQQTVAQLLADQNFVDRFVRDYQTKMFAFDSLDECAATVNAPLEIDKGRWKRALDRLDRVDVVGIAEDLPSFCARFESHFGVSLQAQTAPHNRTGDVLPRIPRRLRRRIERLTRHDHALYKHARQFATPR